MANWAWPHTPADNWAELRLAGGPFDGHRAGFLPPDTAAPIELAWSGWFPWGFSCYVYRWLGGQVVLQGRTSGLIYVFDHRRALDIPHVVSEDADLYADAAEMILRLHGFPGIPEVIADGRGAGNPWSG